MHLFKLFKCLQWKYLRKKLVEYCYRINISVNIKTRYLKSPSFVVILHESFQRFLRYSTDVSIYLSHGLNTFVLLVFSSTVSSISIFINTEPLESCHNKYQRFTLTCVCFMHFKVGILFLNSCPIILEQNLNTCIYETF